MWAVRTLRRRRWSDWRWRQAGLGAGATARAEGGQIRGPRGRRARHADVARVRALERRGQSAESRLVRTGVALRADALVSISIFLSPRPLKAGISTVVSYSTLFYSLPQLRRGDRFSHDMLPVDGVPELLDALPDEDRENIMPAEKQTCASLSSLFDI